MIIPTVPNEIIIQLKKYRYFVERIMAIIQLLSLFILGLVPDPLRPSDDHELVNLGIGLTNLVPKPGMHQKILICN